MPPARFATASLTDVGRVRSANQDICGEFSNADGFHLLVVADGMGGHAGGETASRTALERIGEIFEQGFDDPKAMLRGALEAANQRIHETAARTPELHGMGTTAVALLLGPRDRAWLAHVGDSRAYRIRAGRLEAMTEDHSWVSQQVRSERLTREEARTHPMSNVLLRSVGVAPQVEVDVSELRLEAGDRFLLCSDGLWGEVEDAGIAEILGQATPEAAARALVELANANGGSDNITVQVAVVAESEPAPAAEAGGGASTASAAERGAPLRPGVLIAIALLAAALLWLVFG